MAKYAISSMAKLPSPFKSAEVFLPGRSVIASPLAYQV